MTWGIQCLARRDPLHLRPVLAGMRVARMQQPLVPGRLVAQQQQSLGVRIQPPNGIDIGGKAEVRQRAVRRAVPGELRQDAEWFVEGDEHEVSFQCQVSSFKCVKLFVCFIGFMVKIIA